MNSSLQQLKPSKRVLKSFGSKLRFRLLLMKILPMGFLSGMYVSHLDPETCSVAVPYKWMNKNPFRSTFWAVLGMAAEMSSGALLLLYTHGREPSIAMLIVESTAQFVKKATDITTFTCSDGQAIREAVAATIDTGEPQVIETRMTGTNPAGKEVAHFTFTWSVKARTTST